MFTMALLGRAVESWAGPGAVVEIGCKFTKPVVVPEGDDGVEVTVAGTMGEPADGRATISMVVTCGDEKVPPVGLRKQNRIVQAADVAAR
jgi:acyl dehydratase